MSLFTRYAAIACMFKAFRTVASIMVWVVEFEDASMFTTT